MGSKAGVKGGEALIKRLNTIQANLAKGRGVRMGFLEGAMHPDANLPVATIAAINEFGAQVNMPAREQTIYRSIKDNGEFNRNGRFVKAAKSNYETTHTVEAYTITIPARPFFRHMIAEKSSEWGPSIAKLLKKNNYDADVTLNIMGEGMADQLEASLRAWSDPPNAASTVRAKGFNNPLIDTSFMLNSIAYQVTT